MLSLFILSAAAATWDAFAEFSPGMPYTGPGMTPGGEGGTLDSEVWRMKPGNVQVDYDETAGGQPEFTREKVSFEDSTKTSKIIGGFGAIDLALPSGVVETAMYLQPTTDFFTKGGFVEFRTPLDEEVPLGGVVNVELVFSLWHLDVGPRSTRWQVQYAVGSQSPLAVTNVPNGEFSTPAAKAEVTEWVHNGFGFQFAFQVAPGDEFLYIRIMGVDNEGESGARDTIALGEPIMTFQLCEPDQAGTSLCQCSASNSCNAFADSCLSGICQKNCMTPGSVGCACIGEERGCDTGLACTPAPLNICTVGGCVPGETGCVCDGFETCKDAPCNDMGICEKKMCPPNVLSECEMECASMDKVVGNKCSCAAGEVVFECVDKAPIVPGATPQPPGASGSGETGVTGVTGGTGSGGAGGTSGSPTQKPAEVCTPLTCEQCLVNTACIYCGDARSGSCTKALGSTCTLPEITSEAKCPTRATTPAPTTPATPVPPVVTKEPDTATSIAVSTIAVMMSVIIAA